jgi:2,5-diamino-6-(ribosylamino)-4(3H)-pyrimidinone 5'-phosphate reductase
LTGKALKLYPLPVLELPEDGIYENLELPPPERRRDTTRPYVIINMVSSIDGKAAIGGKASRLGSETDRQTMRALRSKADAVMVGSGTLRAEKLSLALDDHSIIHQPIAVIATRSGTDIPLENLTVEEHQEVLIITTQDAPGDPEDTLHESVRVPATSSGAVDLRRALEILKTERAVEVLLAEGGPSLNHALISSNLADELFLTLAPKLVGGTPDEALTILAGPTLATRDVNLLSVHLAGGELFLRYALAGP